METMNRNVRLIRVSNPNNIDNLDLKKLGRGIAKGFGTVLKVAGTVSGREGLVNSGTKIVDKANANKAKELAKKVAANMPPDKVAKGVELLKSGAGVLTKIQGVIAQNQTDPSMLPKTAALKEAEQKLLLPQTTVVGGVAETIKSIDKKWLIGGAIALAVVIAVVIYLKNK